MAKQDFYKPFLISFFIGFFAMIMWYYLALPFDVPLWLVGVALGVASFIAFIVGFLLGKVLPIIFQIAKFAITGGLNTLIDFTVLNIFSSLTQVVGGIFIVPINIISFSVATINSYFWNRHWTFQRAGEREKMKGGEFLTFIAVSVVGVLLNTSVIYLLTTFVSAPEGFSGSWWLNISKVIATLVSLVWNFLGYKFIVFRTPVKTGGTNGVLTNK